MVIQIEDNDVEGLEEVIYFLNDNTRIIENQKHKERYHTTYHIDGLVYEGMEDASDENIEFDATRAEIEHIDAWLRENLTVVQYKRYRFLMDGMSIREIARQQGVDFSSVNS